MVGLLAFGVMVLIHDSGIPESLSESDQQYVLQKSEELVDKLEEVVDLMRQFNSQPNRESELATVLTKKVDQWYRLGTEVNCDGRFFTPTHNPSLEAINKRLLIINEQFSKATDEMALEVIARRESGEHDQEAYDLLCAAFSQDFSTESAVCDRKNCFWCVCQHLFKKF